MSISKRQSLMAELVLMWGSRDTESAAMQIQLLDRQTRKWDFEVLRLAVRELIDTWEYQSLPGPKHIHAKARIVQGQIRRQKREQKRLEEERKGLISIDDAKRELKVLEDRTDTPDTPLGAMVDTLMVNALRARIALAESVPEQD